MDYILLWNDVALEANKVSHTVSPKEQAGPPLSARALAIVHLAMYDAYGGVVASPALPPYLPGLPPAPNGASPQAAVTGAAYTALTALFPSQQPFFYANVQAAGGTADVGYNYGVAVGNALLQDRMADPDAGSQGYSPSLSRFRHRQDPDNPSQGFHAPYYGARSKLFSATSRHGLSPPPRANSEYIKSLDEVRGLGIRPDRFGTVPPGILARNADQTVLGLFWGYDGSANLGTPPRLYNQIVRRLSIARRTSEVDNARLFALINVAMADAGILAWDQKYIHDFWRPVVAIREHDDSFGPGATHSTSVISEHADPQWLPLGAPASNSQGISFRVTNEPDFPKNRSTPGYMRNFTPPFPAYPSGHATFGAACFHAARLFYGVPVGDRQSDQLFESLDFVSDEFNGVTQDNEGTVRPRHVRRFPGGLWQMVLENGFSRVCLGVHWIFDAFVLGPAGDPDFGRQIGGVSLGLAIAEDIYASGMGKSSVGPR